MAANEKMESFPSLSVPLNSGAKPSSQNTTRRRRQSSILGSDPRGDTGAGAIATNLSPMEPSSAGSTPTTSSFSERKQPAEKRPRERKRKKALKLFRRWKRMSFKHTWVNPLIIIVIVLSAYFVSPGEHNPLHSALFLSYADPPLIERTNTLPAHVGNVTQYGKGKKDFAFFTFYIIVFTFTREFIMQRIAKPVGLSCGIRARGKLSRFMEQFYTAIYHGLAGVIGMWVMSRTPVWYFNTAGMYEGYPHRAHEAYFKAYYLLQGSYWAQQGIVQLLQLEKPRKDFKELVLHHIVTLVLIGLSYRFHFTYIGVAVYVTHDISDFFIATSKMFNYLDFWITGPYFVMFLCIWAYLRHYINLLILKSLLPPGHIPFTSIPTGEFATIGPYELNWELQQYKFSISQPIVFFLLASLQTINIIWFFLLVRIALRYLLKGEQKDERSEDEAEDEEMPEPKLANGELANGKPVKAVAVE
ncbi:sphingosine N-acyltransferase lag1 [Elasticomyces elasticus]|nr:sphingosine N-acyltransferase lag1 [Elasticomyces elasticus]KAK4965416.1 sphingosine N-acyltransferase lag1 [Elasticomyces elasticus]